MQIKINTQNIHLGDHQEEAITKKIEHLTQLSDRLSDESSHIKVDLIHEESRRPEDAYQCHITFFVPQDTLRAEANGVTLEDSVDEAVSKIKGQIERYKTKIHHLDERKKGE